MWTLNSTRHWMARVSRGFPILMRLKPLLTASRQSVAFENSSQYWRKRYLAGGNSGEGSYGKLAAYKADFINNLVQSNGIERVVEFGCGDGHQARMFSFPNYTGIDISEKCVLECRKRLSNKGWSFFTIEDYLKNREKGVFDLSLSLDVIYHLTEDDIYFQYLDRLFESSSTFVVIYSSNFDYFSDSLPHVKHRRFESDVQQRYPEWQMIASEKNPYSKAHDSSEYGSFANFHVFKRS